jgi:hypothetical protein
MLGRTFFVLVDTLDALFEFDDPLAQRAHDAWQATAKQDEHDKANNQQLCGSNAEHGCALNMKVRLTEASGNGLEKLRIQFQRSVRNARCGEPTVTLILPAQGPMSNNNPFGGLSALAW